MCAEIVAEWSATRLVRRLVRYFTLISAVTVVSRHWATVDTEAELVVMRSRCITVLSRAATWPCRVYNVT